MIIKNENLFRTLVCGPSAIVFAIFAQQSIQYSGPIILQIFFTLIAIFFSLSALSHAATYTNDRYEGNASPLFSNENLAKLVTYSPFALLFLIIASNTITSPAHLFFKASFVIIALILTLKALAHAAFYTNDYFEQQPSH